MKKKLLLLTLPLTMALSGCELNLNFFNFGKKTTDTAEQGGKTEQGLTPEQKVEAGKIDNTLYDIVYSLEGEEVAESTKAYTAKYSEEAAAHGVECDKVLRYYADLPKMNGFEDTLAFIEFLGGIKDDDGLDDLVYFAVAFGKTFINVASYLDEDFVSTGEALLEYIEEEGDELPKNIYSLVNKVLIIANKVTAPSVLEAVVNLVDDEDDIITSNLEKVLKTVGNALVNNADIKEPVKYVFNFALNAFDIYNENYPEEEPLIGCINEGLKLIDFDKIIDTIFDGAATFGEAIANMEDEYYYYIKSLGDPLEEYLYAGLGIAEKLTKDFKIAVEEISPTVEGILGLLDDIAGKFEQFAEAQFIQTIVESEKTKNAIVDVLFVLADFVNYESEVVTAKNIAKAITTFKNFDKKGDTQYLYIYNINDVPYEYQSRFDYNQICYAFTTNAQYDYSYSEDEYVFSPITYDWVTNRYSFVKSRISVKAYSSPTYQSFTFEVSRKEVSYGSLQPAIEILAKLFAEVAGNKDFTDTLISDLFKAVKSIKEVADEFELDLAELLEIDQEAIDIFASLSDETIECIQNAVNHLFIFCANASDFFIWKNGFAPTYDFTEVLMMIIENSEYVMPILPDENYVGFAEFLADIYDIAVTVDAAEGLVSDIVDLADLEEAPTITSGEEFAELLIALLKGLFWPTEA